MYEWSSLLCHGRVACTHFLIYFLYKNLEVKAAMGRKSLERFFVELLWSLRALELGLWPETDAYGNAIQGGGFLAEGFYATYALHPQRRSSKLSASLWA